MQGRNQRLCTSYGIDALYGLTHHQLSCVRMLRLEMVARDEHRPGTCVTRLAESLCNVHSVFLNLSGQRCDTDEAARSRYEFAQLIRAMAKRSRSPARDILIVQDGSPRDDRYAIDWNGQGTDESIPVCIGSLNSFHCNFAFSNLYVDVLHWHGAGAHDFVCDRRRTRSMSHRRSLIRALICDVVSCSCFRAEAQAWKDLCENTFIARLHLTDLGLAKDPTASIVSACIVWRRIREILHSHPIEHVLTVTCDPLIRKTTLWEYLKKKCHSKRRGHRLLRWNGREKKRLF